MSLLFCTLPGTGHQLPSTITSRNTQYIIYTLATNKYRSGLGCEWPERSHVSIESEDFDLKSEPAFAPQTSSHSRWYYQPVWNQARGQ